MRRIAGALIGIFAYASVACAGPGDACAVAAHLVHADARLPHVAAAIKAKTSESRCRRNRVVHPAGRERTSVRLSGAARSGAAKKVAGRQSEGYITGQVAADGGGHGSVFSQVLADEKPTS